MEHLFTTQSITGVLASKKNNLSSHINLLEDDFFNKEFDELVNDLYQRHREKEFKLLLDNIAEPTISAVLLNSRNEIAGFNDRDKTQGREVIFSVPFAGNPQMTKNSPSTFSTRTYLGLVDIHQYKIKYFIRKPLNVDIKQISDEFNHWLNKITEIVNCLNADIESYNNDIQRAIPIMLKSRMEILERIKADRDFFKK